MARYRVEFSRDWIRGRWGFIDRFFYRLGGRESEPSRTENAWLVDFKGTAPALGRLIAEQLELKKTDLRQFGSIFEITMVGSPAKQPARRRPRLPDAGRVGAPS
ncbi:MAG: hypothetical protein V3S29_00130 [bacterium]